MKRRPFRWCCRLAALCAALSISTGCVGTMAYLLNGGPTLDGNEVLVRAEKPVEPDPADELRDDRLQDRTPPPFDPDLVDSRPLGTARLNASAAVVRLDVLPRTAQERPGTQTLYPSYAQAAAAAPSEPDLLPSVNLLDGLCKQFDDGLVAALDLAYYRGLHGQLLGHVESLRRLHARLPPQSEAAAYVAAGLELACVRIEGSDHGMRWKWLQQFRDNELASKPIGVYTWTPELATVFRFLRFFQHEFPENDLEIPRALAAALRQDAALLADYHKAVSFYARLTNSPVCLSLADLGPGPGAPGNLEGLCRDRKVPHRSVAVLPPSTSRETVLFEKLFPFNLPASADLMQTLVRRIRSGEVDLRPRPDSGWYEHQVYALETLLLPTRGEEGDKLLLSSAYKKRTLAAFEALLTKRRETHVRELAVPFTCGMYASRSAEMPEIAIKPRLRVEPCPSYYLRTARAYAFLANFLEAGVGGEALRGLHGLRQGGQRPLDLAAELRLFRDRFYGLYLVSAEDLGLKPAFARGEEGDAPRCYQEASAWLPKVWEEPDLKVDTRVLVPIFADGQRQVTRVWATLGVRLVHLDARYEAPPSIQARPGDEWQRVRGSQLEDAQYLIAVDEFVEAELHGLRVPSREEFRALCERSKTKDAILAALR
jgi:hypothetical protein